nr:hypothetical protein L203_04457 [Cryptococcus depauperatus CBS 7841]
MSVPPPETYLAEGFDPSTLRSAGSATSAGSHSLRHLPPPDIHTFVGLIAEFVAHVQSQAATQRETMATIKPSAKGIIAVSSNGEETLAVPAKRPRKSSKTPTIVSIDVPEPIADLEVEAEPQRPAKKPRANRGKNVTVELTPRKHRQSIQPIIQVENVDQGTEGETEDEPINVQAVTSTMSRKSGRYRTSLTPQLGPRTRATVSPVTPGPLLVPVGSSSSAVNTELHTPKVSPNEKPRGNTRKSGSSINRMSHVKEESEGDIPKKAIKKEKVQKTPQKANGEDGGFSDYNPFQSGSEEAAERNRRRRKSSTGLASATKPKASKPRFSEPASTVTPPGILRRVAPSRESLKTPPSVVKRALQTGSNDYEFDLEAAVQHNHKIQDKLNQLSSVPHQEHQIINEGGTQITIYTSKETPSVEKGLVHRVEDKVGEIVPSPRITVPLSVLFFLLLTFVSHFKGQSASIGFCDTGSHTNDISVNRQIARTESLKCFQERGELQATGEIEQAALLKCDASAVPLLPILPSPQECTPCPIHATCMNGEVIACASEYLLSPHPLQFLSPVADGLPGIGPRAFPPTCRPDTVKKRLIGSLAKTIEYSLAQRRGEAVCQGISTDDKSNVEKYSEEEQHLRERFAAQRDEKFSPEVFDEVFEGAIKDLVEHENLVVTIDPMNDKTYYASVKIEMTVACRAKMEAKNLLARWKSQLGSTAAVLVMITYIRSTLNRRSSEFRLIDELTSACMMYLQTLETQHHVDPVLTPRSWAPVDHIRDKLWPTYVQAFPDLSLGDKDKPRIWKRVEENVEKDSNVQTTEKELGGDHWKTWQWIGVGALERVVEHRRVTFE